jgi:ribosomal protein S7
MKNIKLKLYNNLMLDGNKIKCEKILKKSVKDFQKNNKKDHKIIFKNSIIKSTPIIKLCEIKNKKSRKKKKKIFPYVINKKIRLSLGIKLLIKNLEKPAYLNLFEEMEKQLRNDSEIINNQIENYKISVKLKKSSFFRWFF